MKAISVIEHEIAYLKELIMKIKGDDKSYYQSKLDALEFEKESLESSVATGLITPEKYIANVKAYAQKT
jgi:hypothetical protein